MREAIDRFFDYLESTWFYNSLGDLFKSIGEMGSELIRHVEDIPEWLNWLITGVFLGMIINSLSTWIFSPRERRAPLPRSEAEDIITQPNPNVHFNPTGTASEVVPPEIIYSSLLLTHYQPGNPSSYQLTDSSQSSRKGNRINN